MTTIMFIVTLRFVDPLVEQIKSTCHLPENSDHSFVASRKISVLVVGFAILFAVIVHGLLASVVDKSPFGVILLFIASMFSPGVVTYFWIRGVQQQPPRAARLGAVSAALSETLLLLVYLSLVNVVTHQPIIVDVKSIIESASKVALLGFAGGFVIDRHWGKRPSWTVAWAIFFMQITQIMVVFYFFPGSALPDLTSSLFLATGWGLGLIVCRSTDTLLADHNRQSASGLLFDIKRNDL
ncbi:MAG: hypothetical protein ACRESZ_09950 [Methylococcales bacterium]